MKRRREVAEGFHCRAVASYAGNPPVAERTANLVYKVRKWEELENSDRTMSAIIRK